MRSMIILGLVFALVAVPAAQAQQVFEPIPAEQPSLQPVVEPNLSSEANVVPARTAAVQVRHEPVEASAARQVSARNVLAIIGGVVVVLALVAFLR